MEGYSILATNEHIPSMMDLSLEDTKRLCKFTRRVRERIGQYYGEAIITEHGRVAPCIDRDKAGRKSHCFHAHRLVFPTPIDLLHSFHEHSLEVEEYPDFVACRQGFTWRGEYLYYERHDGSCVIASAPYRLVRQFFRYKLARQIGHPELASWEDYPSYRVVEAARRRLMPQGD